MQSCHVGVPHQGLDVLGQTVVVQSVPHKYACTTLSRLTDGSKWSQVVLMTANDITAARYVLDFVNQLRDMRARQTLLEVRQVVPHRLARE